jgi:hypothetical protein
VNLSLSLSLSLLDLCVCVRVLNQGFAQREGFGLGVFGT